MIEDGFPASRVVVQPNIVPDVRAHRATTARERTVVFAGRLTPEKGVATVLEAWRTLVASGAEVPLLKIIGDGPLLDRARAVSDEVPQIEVLGWRSRDEVARHLSTAMFGLIASEWFEAGLPLVGIEACAHGTPLLVSDVGNFSDVVVGEEIGCTFAAGEPKALAALVRSIVDVDHRALSVAARSFYERTHHPSVGVDRLLAVYRAAIAAGGRSTCPGFGQRSAE